MSDPFENKFVSKEKIDAIRDKYQANQDEVENFYGSLSQRAFKGELDLSGVVVENLKIS